MLHERLFPLDPGVAQLADLVRVILGPLAIVQRRDEAGDDARGPHVDEGVTDVAGIAKVDGQVEKVEPGGLLFGYKCV